MSTTASQTAETGKFSIDTREHGHPDGPGHVLVEISPVRRGVLMAICAAGADGRYSFDFTVGSDGVEIEKAYIEGMHEPVDELPDWMDCIVERVETELEVAA